MSQIPDGKGVSSGQNKKLQRSRVHEGGQAMYSKAKRKLTSAIFGVHNLLRSIINSEYVILETKL